MNQARSEDWRRDRDYHESLLDDDTDASNGTSARHGAHLEEVRNAPLFSAEVLDKLCAFDFDSNDSSTENVLPQYGLIAKAGNAYSGDKEKDIVGLTDVNDEENNIQTYEKSQLGVMKDKRLFVNINAPWSMFICGSQGELLREFLPGFMIYTSWRRRHGLTYRFESFEGRFCLAMKNDSGVSTAQALKPINAMRGLDPI